MRFDIELGPKRLIFDSDLHGLRINGLVGNLDQVPVHLKENELLVRDQCLKARVPFFFGNGAAYKRKKQAGCLTEELGIKCPSV